MIRKLRLTFIAIIMSMLAVVLMAGMLVFNGYTFIQEKKQVEAALMLVLAKGPDSLALPSIGTYGPEFNPRDNSFDPHRNRSFDFGDKDDNGDGGGIDSSFTSAAFPVFCVSVGLDGEITLSGGTANIDSTTLESGVELVLASDDSFGELKDLDLFFAKSEVPEGYRIAFSDSSQYHDEMKRAALVSLFVVLGVLAMLFVVSIILARFVTRPVQDAWDKQRQFIADASHELKTPLTVILADNNIIASHPESTVAEQMQWVDGVNEEATKMKGLVSDLLTLAQLESGKDEPHHNEKFEKVDLSSQLESAVLQFEAVAFENGVEIEGEFAEGVWIEGDFEKLSRLTGILIDNACKYAKSKIDVSLVCEGGNARIFVRNDGEQIDQKDIPHLFDRFYRADSSRSDEKPGFGLGLSIAKDIVEHHNGEISAENDARGGVVFSVRLPLSK